MVSQRLFALVLAASLTSTLFAQSVFAQMDPSAALLLNSGSTSGSKTNTKDVRNEPSRYTVRPRNDGGSTKQTSVKRAPVETFVTTGDDDDESPTTVVAPKIENKLETKNDAESKSVTETFVPATSRPDVKPAVAQLVPASPTPFPLVAEEIRIDPNDRRLNTIEINIAPGYLYNDSSSAFSLRRYQDAAPTAAADARVWLSEAFGLQASYLTTLSGDVSDSFEKSKMVPASQQWFTAGVRTRRFFGNPLKPSLLVAGLDYYEYQFHVPADAQTRESLRSAGVKLSLDAEFPANSTRMWTLGVNFTPKLSHKESGTGIDFKSGDSVETNGVGISFGQKFYFDRSSAMFWKLSHAVEKNLFSGSATVEDPLRSEKPAGVAVTNSFTQLQFGYTWGD